MRRDSRCPGLIYYVCSGYFMRWKADPCHMRWLRADVVEPLVWRRIKEALSHPEFVLRQMRRSSAESQTSEIERNIWLAQYQIRHAESGIALIQQAYENGTQLYTAEEAERRISVHREKWARAAQRKQELETSLERINQDTRSTELVVKALTKIHQDNLRDATLEDKVRIIDILDVKVYPSENLDHIGVTCALNLAGLEEESCQFSCHSINIASPKL